MAKVSPVVEAARERFKRAAEAEHAQRVAIVLAKEFRAGNQWPDDIKKQRQGGAALVGQAAQPPRPCLTIDRLSQPVRQISNSVRAANFAIDVRPNGHGADDATADIYKGIIRRIQAQARSDAPIDWAADGAAEGGIGWFRLRTDYIPLPPGTIGPEVKDQDITLERIANNLTVYCDPGASKPTRSDARWMIVTEEITKDEAKRKWGLTEADFASLDEFMATGDQATSGWVTDHTLRIAEYWRIEDDETTVVQLDDQTFVEKTKDLDETRIIWQRTIARPKVKMSVINAVKELEKSEWAGSHIPLIPILGEELNVDGHALLRGIIQEGMDAQRMVNYMYSAAIETVALAPKSPLVIAEGQLEGYETIWQTANRFNYSYLPYKPTSLAGNQVPPPARDNTEPAIQAMVLMLQKSEEAIKATTGIFDPSLGNTNPREKSGRAILALQKSADQGTSNYLDNVQRALVYAGEQLVELIPKIYDRPGRILQILGLDDEPEQVMVGQPYQPGPDGVPQPVNLPPEAVKLQKGLAQFYDLQQGRYAVTVSVSKAHATRREEGADKLGEIIAAAPQMLQIIGDLWARDLDIPGAEEMADRLKKMLPPPLQAKEGTPEIPPEVQAQLQQMQQMVQMLTQELQAKTQVIETDQIKNQAQIQIKQIQESAESQRKTAELETERQLQMAKLQIELRKIEVTAEIEAAKLGSAEALKRLEIEANLLHQHGERELQAEQIGAEIAGAEADRQFQREEQATTRLFDATEAASARETPTNGDGEP